MIRVLVVDDHDLMRSGLISMLGNCSDVEIAGEAADGCSAVRLALELRPDVVLMDVRMPVMDGMAATRSLLRHWPEARVLALTACSEESAVRQLIRAGAMGFITKDATLEQVLQAMRRAIRGQRTVSDALASCLDSKPRSQAEGPFADLTGRELEITRQVAAGRRAKEIARRLYITSKTVHTYRYRIFDKLGIHSDVELTRLALQHGLIKDG